MDNRLPTLQSLRAAAALAVMAFHLAQWMDLDFRIGQAGVDLFFVISGAVMWISAVERDAPPGLFLARRAVRILPPYWVATLALVGLTFIAPRPTMLVHPEPWHVVLSLLLVPHNDPLGVPFPLLTQGWTLVYEAGFYLVVALALAIPKPGRLWLIGAILVGLALWGIAWQPAYWLGANLMLVQFLAGCWLGRAAVRGALPSPTIGVALGALGLAVFAALHLMVIHSEPWRPILWGIPAALIVLGALSLDTRSGVAGPPRLPALEWLGGASYSLYLWHTLAYFLVVNWMPYKPWYFGPIAFAAAMAAGLIAWRLVEIPALAASRRLRVPRPEALDYSLPPNGPVAQPDRAGLS